MTLSDCVYVPFRSRHIRPYEGHTEGVPQAISVSTLLVSKLGDLLEEKIQLEGVH